MLPLNLESLFTQLCLFVISAVVGWLGGRLSTYSKSVKAENEALKQGVRALLRSDLMHTHHAAIRDGFCSTTDKEIMERTYRAYHALGGNGVATNLYEEFMRLPTRED